MSKSNHVKLTGPGLNSRSINRGADGGVWATVFLKMEVELPEPLQSIQIEVHKTAWYVSQLSRYKTWGRSGRKNNVSNRREVLQKRKLREMRDGPGLAIGDGPDVFLGCVGASKSISQDTSAVLSDW